MKISLTNRHKQGDSPEKRLALISGCLDTDKAEDLAIYDLRDKTPMADYMIVATGRSSTHIKALANKIVERCKEFNIKRVKAEGQAQGDWVLIDAGDVIVHLFRQEVRSFYDLDKLWQECAVENKKAYTSQVVHA